MLTEAQFNIIVEMLRGFTEHESVTTPMDRTKKTPPVKLVKIAKPAKVEVVKSQTKPVVKQPPRIPTPEPEPEEITESGAVKSYSNSYYDAHKEAITRRRLLKKLEDGQYVSDKLISKYKLNDL